MEIARLILLLAFAAPAARGGDFGLPVYRSGMKSVGFDLGLGVPGKTGGFASVIGNAPEIDIQFFRFFGSWIALGGELSYQYFLPKKFADPALPGNTVDGKGSVLNLGLVMRLNAFENRSWTPYIVGGIGRHQTTLTSVKAGPLATGTVSGGGISYTGGAGVEGFVMDDASLAAEVRFRQYRLDPSASTDHLEVVSFLLGARLWFGLD